MIPADVFRTQPVLVGPGVRLEPLTQVVLDAYLRGLADPEVRRLTGSHSTFVGAGVFVRPRYVRRFSRCHSTDSATRSSGAAGDQARSSSASGADGVALAERLGADVTVNGREHDVAAAAREFAPDGIDAALLTAGGEAAERALETLREGGRVAYPRGVQPEPEPRPGLVVSQYVGDDPAPEVIEKLNRLIASGPFEVHVARAFPLNQAGAAHRALDEHYLGKLILKVDQPA